MNRNLGPAALFTFFMKFINSHLARKAVAGGLTALPFEVAGCTAHRFSRPLPSPATGNISPMFQACLDREIKSGSISASHTGPKISKPGSGWPAIERLTSRDYLGE
jgi:hypothetical protein